MSTSSILATVKSVDDTGGWTAIASAPSIDRDNEVVEARCFSQAPGGLPEQVPVRSAHFGGELVGSGRPYYVANRLQIDGRFASTPKAQEVRTLVKEGHLTTMSVVFLPLTDRQVEGRRHITSAELLAIDWAEIPSQRDARVLAVRGYDHRKASESAAYWKARIACMEAEIAMLDLDTATRAKGPNSLAEVYRELADVERFLARLDRRL